MHFHWRSRFGACRSQHSSQSDVNPYRAESSRSCGKTTSSSSRSWTTSPISRCLLTFTATSSRIRSVGKREAQKNEQSAVCQRFSLPCVCGWQGSPDRLVARWRPRNRHRNLRRAAFHLGSAGAWRWLGRCRCEMTTPSHLTSHSFLQRHLSPKLTGHHPQGRPRPCLRTSI